MDSLASSLNLGTVNKISFCKFHGFECLDRRVSFHRDDISFRKFWSGKRLKYVGICKYYVIEQGASLSLDSTNSVGSPPNPVLKSGPKVDPLFSIVLDEGLDNERVSDKEKERSTVIETLGEALEKAEKLENSEKVNAPINKPLVNETVEKTSGSSVNSVGKPKRKSKTLKGVWRKGDAVGIIRKVVKEPQKQECGTDGGVDYSKSVAPSRPLQPPQKVQLNLQRRPYVAPPPLKKKPVGDGTDMEVKANERKPILIDKFASKRPVVDSLIAQTVLAPPKLGRNRADGKYRGEFRKKKGSSGGAAGRRMVNYKDDILGANTAGKGRKWSKSSRKAARRRAARDAAPVRAEIMEVGEDGMLTEELSYNLAVSEGEILGYLYSKGIKPDGVLKLSKEMVKIVCNEYEVEIIDALPIRVEDLAKKKERLDEDDLDKLGERERPPVLTIMGHVDHGKTTLLDFIRKTKVAAAEAGGITQGIGAYKVQVLYDGKTQTCVFLDTPGHEAFGAMRARGARVTDIVVIVVAADDGIQPQTSEAIAHAKSAGVPIIIAINKIDKDGANPDRVIQDLSSAGLMPEEWGGDIPMVKISALNGENVDELLETIMLVAEFQELKANPDAKAKGTVVEAGLDKSKGPLATIIIQNGTLRIGDIVVCGEAFGKVRALFDDNGKRVDEAGPSIPIQVTGLSNVPLAGDDFEVVVSLDIARGKAMMRAEYLRNERITEKAGDGKITLSSLASAVSAGKTAGLDLHQFTIILKVDVQGSIEAIKQALQALPQDNVTLKFILQSTGDVNTSDVDLAMATKAIIFGFNIRTPGSVKKYADSKNVEVRLYKIIYELIDDVRNAMEGLLDLVEERIPIGTAEVRAVFRSGSSRVAGCLVTDGEVVKDCGISVLRKGKEVTAGVVASLRRVKEMVNVVNAGLECGIGIDGFDDWEEGDTLMTFNLVQKKRTLEKASASISAALEQARIHL